MKLVMPEEGTVADLVQYECFWCGKPIDPLTAPRFEKVPEKWEETKPAPGFPIHSDCIIASGAGTIFGNQRLAIRYRQRLADTTSVPREISDGWVQ